MANETLRTFVIRKIEQNQFDQSPPMALSTLYMYEIGLDGKEGVEGSSIRYAEVQQLMLFFGVQTPAELTGKKFPSYKSDGYSALKELVVLQLHGGSYTAPDASTVWQQITNSLLEMKCPDFSNDDPNAVAAGIAEGWDGWKAHPKWLDRLKENIFDRSNGQITLSEAPVEAFHNRIKGPCEYLQLVKKDSAPILLILGPYSTPVCFDK